MIKFFWWNTSLSHKNKQNISDEDKVIIWKTINELISKSSLDILILTEVREQDIKDIYENCSLNEYKVEYECSRAGKAWFDICIIYKNSFELILKQAIQATRLNKTHKIGVRFDLLLLDQKILHLFASHWPSNLQQSSEDKRIFNAQNLRVKINELMNEYRKSSIGEPYIILMGDYNNEPFDKSVSYCLQSSRDENLVKENKDLLFNPFWKDLSRINDNVNIGTCYYKSGDLTKWKTFDQIMYSHAFINSNNWKFINTDDRIFTNELLLKTILNNQSKLDHLPIFGIIEKHEE